MRLPIYLDNNATTPVDPRVVEAMLPYLREHFGNPASRQHAPGRMAQEAVEAAREQVGRLIGAAGKDIVITSGATESNNLAVKGVVEMYADGGRHVVTCATEHKAVLDPCEYLASRGCEVTVLVPDRHGRVSAEQVDQALTDRTVLITLMTANNEIGTLHPIAAIGKLAKARGVLFHTDATQAVGKVPVDVDEMGVDLLSLSAHKLYGPKGVGALYVRRRSPRVRLTCQMHGGGHERGMRSGTINSPGVVGMGAACEFVRLEMPHESPKIAALRDRLHAGITERLDDVELNGHPTDRLPNTLNLSLAGIEGETMLLRLSDVAASTGSACTSAGMDSSHVLRAIGVPDELAQASIRFSLGRFNTEQEIDYAIDRIATVVHDLRRPAEMPAGVGGLDLTAMIAQTDAAPAGCCGPDGCCGPATSEETDD